MMDRPTYPIRELGPATWLHDPNTLSVTVKEYMSRQSVHALLHGFPDEPIQIMVKEDGSLTVADGNHRVNELYQRYRRDEISGETPVPYEPYDPA